MSTKKCSSKLHFLSLSVQTHHSHFFLFFCWWSTSQGLPEGGPRHCPERVSPSATVAPRPTASGGARDTVLCEPMTAPFPKATVQDRRFVRRMHRVRPRPSRHPNKRRARPVFVWGPPRKDRTACHKHSTGTRPHVWLAERSVPKLVDEVEVTASATANSSQYLLEDADDGTGDPAVCLVQMLEMESAEAPSTVGAFAGGCCVC